MHCKPASESPDVSIVGAQCRGQSYEPLNRVSIFDWSEVVGQPNWYRSNLHNFLSVFERLDRFEMGWGSFGQLNNQRCKILLVDSLSMAVRSVVLPPTRQLQHEQIRSKVQCTSKF